MHTLVAAIDSICLSAGAPAGEIDAAARSALDPLIAAKKDPAARIVTAIIYLTNAD